MSKAAITKVVQRAISDAGFRRQLSTDPTGALRGFDLSADEAAALRTGDAGRLSALGVDQRMSKAFVLGGASLAATRPGGTDPLNASGLNAGGANALSNADATGAGGSFGNALVSGSDANAALIDDGASGIRTIIPTEPGGNLTADIDGAAGMSNASVDDSSEAYLTKVGYDDRAAANADASGDSVRASAINDDPDGFLAANANADLSGNAQSVRTGDDWKFAGGAAAPAARAGDDWARAGSAQADTSASSARSINDDPDGFLAANANADLSGGSVGRSINDDPDGFLAANANADLSGGATGDGTAFIDNSEAYLTKVGYDSNAADSVVTDAHDRGGDDTVTRIADDGDTGGASAASEDAPIDS